MVTSLASEDYLKDNAQHCPHCNVPIEKNEGCNKVSGGTPGCTNITIVRSLAGDVELTSVGSAVPSSTNRIPTPILISLEVRYFLIRMKLLS